MWINICGCGSAYQRPLEPFCCLLRSWKSIKVDLIITNQTCAVAVLQVALPGGCLPLAPCMTAGQSQARLNVCSTVDASGPASSHVSALGLCSLRCKHATPQAVCPPQSMVFPIGLSAWLATSAPLRWLAAGLRLLSGAGRWLPLGTVTPHC